MKNGVPSHDTFNRFFSALAPNEFEEHFIHWAQTLINKNENEFVSIDDKTIRQANKMLDSGGIHIVNAWANQNEIALGQLKTDDKSNEITAIPKLLDALFLDHCIVSIDAMGCQKAVAEKIREKNADYILAVKENQAHLYDTTETKKCRLEKRVSPFNFWVNRRIA